MENQEKGDRHMRIILLNGPPRSGKDTAADELISFLGSRSIDARKYKFATALKERAHAMYGMTDAPPDAFESVKDERNSAFYGLTPRQAYIEVSERYFKAVHGDDFFGRLLAEELRTWRPEIALVSDSGFLSEALVLIEEFGADNMSLVRIHREGTDFKNDSRGYLDIFGIKTYDVDNDGTRLELVANLRRILNP